MAKELLPRRAPMFRFSICSHRMILKFKTAHSRFADRNSRRWALLVILWFGVTAPRMHSQMAIKPDVAFETSDITLEKQVREVNLALTVTDGHGHFVNKLTPSDLLILDNDQRAEQITYFESRSNLPLQIALVIDTSESVAYCFNSERKTAARFLKRNLHSDRDTALIMTFSERVRIAQQPTTDAGLLERSLKHVQAGGAIYDAVSAASQELGKTKSPQPSRRVIILITDGEDN